MLSKEKALEVRTSKSFSIQQITLLNMGLIIQQIIDLVREMGIENNSLEGKLVRWATALGYTFAVVVGCIALAKYLLF